MGKYTTETVRTIPNNEIAKELLVAQQENIAKANPDVQLIIDEIARRLNTITELTEENARLKAAQTEPASGGKGGWKD